MESPKQIFHTFRRGNEIVVALENAVEVRVDVPGRSRPVVAQCAIFDQQQAEAIAKVLAETAAAVRK